MRVINTVEHITPYITNTSVTLGNFDGVHIAHQQLITATCDYAKQNNYQSVIITFEPHPLKIVSPENAPLLISSLEEKIELFAKLSPDFVLILPFTKELSLLSATEFVQHFLVKSLHTQKLFVGYDYALGKKREGNVEKLQTIGSNYSFSVCQLPPICVDDEIISSSLIRNTIAQGLVHKVPPILGRFYNISGTVVHGKKQGRLLGFPTANLKSENELIPPNGVYASWIERKNMLYPAVTNIGNNPTFGENERSIESHIFNFDADIYDEKILVHFVQQIRDEKKFNSLDELKIQIKNDCAMAEKILTHPLSTLHKDKPYIL